jgi:hypothetical protein
MRMRSWTRFLYDDKGRPIVTICTIQVTEFPENSIVFSRGIAICSPLDIKAGKFSRANGACIAEGRALKAANAKESWGAILNRGWKNAQHTSLGLTFDLQGHVYKMDYSIRLTPEEADYFNVLILQRQHWGKTLHVSDLRV